MAVVWGTVQDHRGYIDIESKEGKGTTFYLYLPVTRDRIVEKKSMIPVEAYMGTGQSILIVDDVRDQRELASRMLTMLGYSANTVSNGEGAIDYLKNNSTALVLLDMIMDPGIDGLDTYRQILKLHPKQKAIIASGFSETKRVKEAQKLGAGQYVKKPYTLENLGLAVRKELGEMT
jgi:DNA-binding NtrC family response regulator